PRRVRDTRAGAPGGADLATATRAGNSSGSGGYYPGTFGSPATLTSGSVYALVVRPVTNPSAGTYAYVVSNTAAASSNPYAGGKRYTSTNSGGTWTSSASPVNSLGFHTYMNTGHVTSGNFISSAKDANPAAGWYPNWGTLTFTTSTPANTTITFQAAASNNPAGVFNYVGPFTS